MDDKAVLVPGETVNLCGEALILPALPLVKVSGITPIIVGSPNPLADDAYIKAFVDAMYWSLRRNYPDIDQQFVADHIDLKNFGSLLAAFVKVNALGGGDSSSGEATASPTTGMKSLST